MGSKNNSRKSTMVSEQRNYKVKTTEDAKAIVSKYLNQHLNDGVEVSFGLPEIYDRYDIWNVPVKYNDEVIGEIAVNAYSEEIDIKLSSDVEVLSSRIDKINSGKKVAVKKCRKKKQDYIISTLNNTLIKGRAEVALKTLPDQSIDLIFTSPPYYNARKQYSEYDTYEDYLSLIRKVVRECRRVLIDGKFFIINSSHVLVPRSSRNESSSRIAVPFDIHQIFIEEGFEFVDDIIWQKPEGAGWASGRGRRFSADRNPMQYKAVPVTEYVMVYRKKPAILIDHFIRDHPNPKIVEESKIEDGYEKTNVWYISPARDPRHPAIFPKELAERVIKYYSFKNDVVLDPFGGIGTTAKAAIDLERRFVSIECSDEYIESTKNDLAFKKSLFWNGEYDYFEVETPREVDKKEYCLTELVKRLIEQGVSSDEITKCLLDKYADKL